MKTGATPGSRSGIGRIALAPVFSRTAQTVAQHFADFPGIQFDSVRVIIRGNPDSTVIVKDTTVFFAPNSDDLTLDISVPVQNDGQRFNAAMDYRGPGGVVFHGAVLVQSHAPDQPAPDQQVITINYVGPGSRVRAISVAPKSVALLGAQGAALTVTAVDSTGASTTVPPIAWTSSNASVASVTSAGVVRGQSRRGTVTVTAMTPTGLTDNASVAVTLPAASIGVVSGSGQTGKAGTTLASPAVVQVSASDGVGVPGVNVVFGAPAGGAVTPASVTTDASGRASATLKLGTVTGPQGFSATAAGFSTAVSVTATAGDPAAIAVVAGSGQTDSVHATLSPLSVKVSDSFGNGVAGATVTWARTGGTGALAAASSTTNADGAASNSYTLGSTVGPEAVSATAGSASAAFTFTTTGGRPAAITAVSGSGQTGRVLQALGAPLVVKVTDASGNPASNAAVSWSASNGTITPTTTTDAGGQSSATWTLGSAAGASMATARIANGQSASFGANVVPGPAVAMVLTTQPANGSANQILGPVRLSLRDAANNATPATNSVTIALTNPNGATLGGTRTRDAVGGVVTFDDLMIDRAGSGYTFTVASSGLNSVTTSSFSIVAGAASGLSVAAGLGQTATVNSAVAIAPSVKVVDASNNPISGLAVTFAPAAGSGSVAPANGVVTTNAQGVATLGSWTLGTIAGPQSLTVSANGLQSIVIPATATAAAPFRYVLLNKAQLQGTATSGQALAPQPIVQMIDQYGNAANAPSKQVTATLTASAGMSLAGGATIDVSATNGRAAYAGLAINGTGSTRIVFADPSGAIKPDTSGTVSVASAGPSQLLVYPANAGTSFTVTAGTAVVLPQVKVADAQGNGVAGVAIHAVLDSGTTATAVIGAGDYTSDAAGLVSIVAPPAQVASVYRVTITSAAVPSASIVFRATVTAGAASQVRFLSAPPSAATVGQPVAVSVQLRDAFGNVAPVTGAAVTIVASGPGTITGGGPVQSTNGTAAFSITFNTPGSYTLIASSGQLTSATSGSISVAAGAATQLVLVPATPTSFTLVAGAPVTGPSIRVMDVLNNGVAGVPVHFVIDSGTAPNVVVIGTQDAPSDATGYVHLPATLPTRAGTYRLTATSSAIANASVTVSAQVVPAAATKLAFDPAITAQTVAAAGRPFAVRIRVLDAFDNLVTTASPAITVTSTGPGAITGGGPVSAGNGVASFEIGFATPGAYTLTASSAPLAAASTPSFTVTTGVATSLAFRGPPAAATAGQAMGAVVVDVRDAAGNVVPTATTPVTIALANNPSGAVLGGTLTQAPVNGVATFNDLVVDKAGTGYTLRVTSGTLAGATSAAFDVQTNPAGIPTSLVLVPATPASIVAPAGSVVTSPQLRVLDALGNGVASVGVHFVVDSGAAHVAIAQADFATDASGFVNFTGRLPTVVGNYRVTASSAAVPSTTVSLSVNITPGPATRLAFVPVPGGTVVGQGMPVGVALRDAFGNAVTQSGVAVDVAMTSGPAPLSGGGAAQTVNGIASYTLGFTAAGSYTIAATSAGLTAANATFAVTNPPVTHLGITGGANGSVEARVDIPVFTVSALDANNNVVTSAAGTVTLSLLAQQPALGASATTSGATLTGTVSKNLTNGTATFSALEITSPGAAFQIQAAWDSFTATTPVFGVTSAPVLMALSGPFQATPGATVGPRIRVTSNGANVAGRNVRFAPAQGSGSILGNTNVSYPATTTLATDANGEAAVSWGLPSSAGTYQMTVMISGSSVSTTFTATAATPTATSIIASGSTSFTGQAGTALTSLPAVVVKDQNGNPLAGVVVTFTGTNAGTFAPASATTDASGVAALTQWTLPSTAGQYTVVASVANVAGSVTFTATAVGGSPSRLSIHSGDQQGAYVSTALAAPLAARVTDALGNALPNTVVGWAVAGGSGTLAAATSTTDANGVASMGFTVAATATGANRIRASVGDLTADFIVVGIPAGYSHFWNGNNGSRWDDAGNWTAAPGHSGGAPGNADKVFIPAGRPTIPRLNGHAQVGGVRTEHLAGVDANGFDLTVNGDIDATGPVFGGGRVLARGRGAVVKGGIPELVVQAEVTLGGATVVNGHVTVDAGGSLSVGAQGLVATGNLVVRNRLVMQDAAGAVSVNGNASFEGGDESGLLTAGAMVVGGNLSQSGAISSASLRSTGSHSIVLNGTGAQTVTLANNGSGCCDSWLNNLTIAKNSGTVSLGSPLRVTGNLVVASPTAIVATPAATNVDVAGSLQSAPGSDLSSIPVIQLNGTGQSFPFIGGTGPGLTRISGSMNHSGGGTIPGDVEVTGTLDVSQAQLTIGRNFSTQGNGRLVMGAGGAGMVVQGNATFGGGDESGSLSEGTLEVRGNFAQTGNVSSSAFRSTGTHVLLLSGSNSQTVTFANSGSGCCDSWIQHLQIAKAAGTVSLNSFVRVAGDLVVLNATTVTAPGLLDVSNNLEVGGSVSAPTANFSGLRRVNMTGTGRAFPQFGTPPLNLQISGAISAGGTISHAGNIDITGTLNGAASNLDLTVTGNLRTLNTGTLVQAAGSRIAVTGDASFGGGDESDKLTGGTLEVRGNFTQTGASSASSFRGTQTHVLRLTGAGTQTVSFGNAGRGCCDSWAANFEIAKPSGDVTLASPLVVRNNLNVTSQTAITGKTIDVDGLLTSVAGSSLAGVGVLNANGTGGVFPHIGGSSPAELHINGDQTLDADLSTTSRTIVSGSVFVGAHHLTVDNDFTTSGSGALNMTDPLGLVTIGGAATFAGGDESNRLSAGVLEVKGSFTQTGSVSTSSFRGTGSHVLRLTGSGAQSLLFSNSGSGCCDSWIQNLEIRNGANGLVSTGSYIRVAGTAAVYGRLAVPSAKTLDVAGGMHLYPGSTLTVGGVLHGPCVKDVGAVDSNGVCSAP